MGRRTVTRLMDLSDYTATVNKRDAFRHNLWGRGCNPPRSKLCNAENELLYSRRQRWTIGGKPRFDRGKKRKSNDPIGLLPPEAQAGVWCQYKVEAISTKGFNIKESYGCCQESMMGKARTQLGRTIPNYFSSKNRCILLRRLRWKSCTSSMEWK